MKYNLDGQKGPAGEINPDNLAAGPYIYDNPPGQGDNKGLTAENKPVDPEQHKTKQTGEPLKGNAYNVIKDSINNLNDISDNPVIKSLNFTPSQRFNLGEKLNVSAGEIKKAQQGPIIGDRRNPFRLGQGLDPISQMQFETDYIKNFVVNRKKIKEQEAKGRDTRSLEQKETDYIKNYLETGVLGKVDFKEENFSLADITGDINYTEQLNNETEFIKNFIDNAVSQGTNNNKSNEEIVDDIVEESSQSEGNNQTQTTNNQGDLQIEGAQQSNQEFISFVNIPTNALLFNVDNNLFIAYEVPGLGTLYEGSSMYLAYEIPNNNLVDAGILPPGMAEPTANVILPKSLFDKIAVVTGNTDQLTADIDNPFASFVETISEQAQVAPWITDREMLQLIAEAAVEGRTVSDAEWQSTNWYQTHSEPEREWLRTFYADPSTAAQTITDGQIAVGNALQAAGVSNAPEALVNWIADKFVTGQWTQNYTTEQISLFADPYAEGKRDTDLESYLTSTAITGVDRTSQREAEVKQLYSEYLGPVLGKITDGEAAEIAGKLRNDPDYRDQLVASLKQSRLAAFSAYTNPELTYEDIARPWRNLTASVWGQTADETQGWWQDMVKTNDFAQAEETLRTKGLELDITQVTQDATTALTQALGQGNISQSGVNV